MATARRYDLYSHEFRLTTHETYARMREESPVHLQPGLDGETRLPGMRPAIEEHDLYWRPIPIFRSLASLPLAWDA